LLSKIIIMASVQYTAIVANLKGKLSGTVFQKGNQAYIIHHRVKPRNPRTGLQQSIRSNMAFIASTWRSLSDTDRNSWFLSPTPAVNGYYLYLKNNAINMNAGIPFSTVYTPAIPTTNITVNSPLGNNGGGDFAMLISPADVPLTWVPGGQYLGSFLANGGIYNDPINMFGIGDLVWSAGTYGFNVPDLGFGYDISIPGAYFTIIPQLCLPDGTILKSGPETTYTYGIPFIITSISYNAITGNWDMVANQNWSNILGEFQLGYTPWIPSGNDPGTDYYFGTIQEPSHPDSIIMSFPADGLTAPTYNGPGNDLNIIVYQYGLQGPEFYASDIFLLSV
jgi:hypothetical protein